MGGGVGVLTAGAVSFTDHSDNVEAEGAAGCVEMFKVHGAFRAEVLRHLRW